MKKILIAIISAMILMPTMANAQIQVKEKQKSNVILSLRMGCMNLCQIDNSYYLVMLTDNRYDDAMMLQLGESREAAIQSLNDLIEIFSTLPTHEHVEIDNGFGRELRIYKIAMGGICIFADGYAGKVNTAKSEMKKLLNALQ